MSVMIPAWIDGVLTPVEKLEAHQRGLPHKAVSVFAIWDGKILVQRRALGKYHTPGLWANTCCTHPFWEEPATNCAHRRLKEELGLNASDLQARGRVEYRADVGNGLIEHEHVDVYVVHLNERPDLTLNPDEVIEVAWFTLDELRQDIATYPDKYTPWLKIYLNDHAARIFQSDFV